MDAGNEMTRHTSACDTTATHGRVVRRRGPRRGQGAAVVLLLSMFAAACGLAAGRSRTQPSAPAGETPVAPVEFNSRPEETCDPQITAEDAERLRRSPRKQDTGVSARLDELLAADQRARSGMAGANQLSEEASARLDREDAESRAEVLGLLREGRLSTAQDMEKAATIFNHGRCLDHFALASVLAAEAVARGSTQARRTYAVTLDRYLVAAGRPQKFGTQMRGVPGQPGACEVAPVDPATTDEERRAYGVEPLADLRAKAASGQNRCVAPPSSGQSDPDGGGPGPTPGARPHAGIATG